MGSNFYHCIVGLQPLFLHSLNLEKTSEACYLIIDIQRRNQENYGPQRLQIRILLPNIKQRRQIAANINIFDSINVMKLFLQMSLYRNLGPITFQASNELLEIFSAPNNTLILQLRHHHPTYSAYIQQLVICYQNNLANSKDINYYCQEDKPPSILLSHSSFINTNSMAIDALCELILSSIHFVQLFKYKFTTPMSKSFLFQIQNETVYLLIPTPLTIQPVDPKKWEITMANALICFIQSLKTHKDLPHRLLIKRLAKCHLVSQIKEQIYYFLSLYTIQKGPSKPKIMLNNMRQSPFTSKKVFKKYHFGSSIKQPSLRSRTKRQWSNSLYYQPIRGKSASRTLYRTFSTARALSPYRYNRTSQFNSARNQLKQSQDKFDLGFQETCQSKLTTEAKPSPIKIKQMKETIQKNLQKMAKKNLKKTKINRMNNEGLRQFTQEMLSKSVLTGSTHNQFVIQQTAEIRQRQLLLSSNAPPTFKPVFQSQQKLQQTQHFTSHQHKQRQKIKENSQNEDQMEILQLENNKKALTATQHQIEDKILFNAQKIGTLQSSEAQFKQTKVQNTVHNRQESKKQKSFQYPIQKQKISNKQLKSPKQSAPQKQESIILLGIGNRIDQCNCIGEAVGNSFQIMKEFTSLFWQLPMFLLYKSFLEKRIKLQEELEEMPASQLLREIVEQNVSIEKAAKQMMKKTLKKIRKTKLKEREIADLMDSINLDFTKQDPSSNKRVFMKYFQGLEDAINDYPKLLPHFLETLDACLIINNYSISLDERQKVLKAGTSEQIEYCRKAMSKWLGVCK